MGAVKTPRFIALTLPKQFGGIDMASLFIDGLKTARELIQCGCGLEELDALIATHEADLMETTSIRPDVETR